MTIVLFWLTFLALLGCALMSGLFFIFSNTVMRALGRLPTTAGIAAMQNINAVILNPVFLGTFMGTAILGVATPVLALVMAKGPAVTCLALGGISYVLGVFGVTVICNVPMNNVLERTDTASPQAETVWREYLVRWTRWNHVRAACSIVATGAFAMGLRMV